jgi:hypothetical protein
MATLRSNGCGADHRKHRTSIVARVRFRGSASTKPLPSNKLSGMKFIPHFGSGHASQLSEQSPLPDNPSQYNTPDFQKLYRVSQRIKPTASFHLGVGGQTLHFLGATSLFPPYSPFPSLNFKILGRSLFYILQLRLS